MSPAMNVRYRHSLRVYTPEWKGRIIVQAPSFKKLGFFLRLAYNMYTPPHLLRFILFDVHTITVSF